MIMTIKNIIQKYKNKLDAFDTEIIIANSLAKPREFILTHPEATVTSHQSSVIEKNIGRRIKGEPLAYITEHKEFYGLDFSVNKHTLIPRPETEILVEDSLKLLRNMLASTKHDEDGLRSQSDGIAVADIGTGSGNIIISLAHELKNNKHVSLFGIDMSEDALEVAQKNAKLHKVADDVDFLHGSLLEPLIRNLKLEIRNSKIVILANLPYLSKDIYESAPKDVKDFEPKSALYSPKQGLGHYEELLSQIKESLACRMAHVTCYMEISPEQKTSLQDLIKEIFPEAKTEFKKDLAGKWRVAKVTLTY
ncbi:MAG TPA: peptide chain release factor N(5)-glutamine methyltransferase [Candidatus Moranbacteria bacterium]|nr:peptide chain release factor N(5)-glutamine methyltransferase [Candidatus Moranbacteria bacterium]